MVLPGLRGSHLFYGTQTTSVSSPSPPTAHLIRFQKRFEDTP